MGGQRQLAASTMPSGKLFSILSSRRRAGLLMIEVRNDGSSTHVL